MSHVLSIHSFRGGTGKSSTTANVAAVLAASGRRVGVIDLDILSPGIHVLLGWDQEQQAPRINDFLWGACDLVAAAHDVTPPTVDGDGRLWLVPASVQTNDIARVIHEGYDVDRLHEGVRQLVSTLSLDVLLLDTHPGLNEETLLSIALSDTLAVVLRPDNQDYEGTHVTVSVARRLSVPRLVLVVNKTPAVFSHDHVRARVEGAYDCPVAAVIPHDDELMAMSSSGVFAVDHPDHPLTDRYRDLAARLVP